MRYYFHIVDKYGLTPDGIGCEYSDQDAAVLHARRIAAELAKAGEFCRAGVVLLAAAPGPSSRPGEGAAAPPQRHAGGAEPTGHFLPLLPTENP
ncbi:hypothetical protein P0R31_19290 [Bradyrhizobium yuanmingense]|uniref:DUF6894 family protein n=1 Tax=Bradyrhizobium yuanmingense TaxID=108015 RepID=UPI0023B8C1C5|nr:hypothetical protein [Bradyrhizobium yuanmingense]MDF0519384.1 hypothetical protein [Bradyrhizobium yuanmingense]